MADTKISGLTELTTGNLANGDLIPVVDISDTTMAATGTDKKVLASSVKTYINTAPVFAAGSASASTWPTLTAGTLLTTAEDGAIEMDADCVYMTTDAGNRGIVPITQLIRQDAAYTLSSVTTAQQVFNAATNGRITLETGTYTFKSLIAMTAMSATSGNLTFDIAGGTATLGTIIWWASGRDAASDAATGTWQGSYSTDTTLTTAPLYTAGTATTTINILEGTFEVTAAGTFQLRVLLQTAAAASVTAGSYLTVTRIGSQTATTVGQWD